MDRIITEKNIIKKRHIPYIATLLFLAIAAIWYFTTDHRSYLKTDIENLITAPVKKAPFNDFIRITGKITPTRSVLLTPKENGVVEKILAEEGSSLKKGDPILLLSNSQLSLAILESEASLAEKENFLRNTMVQMEQQKLELSQNRLVSEIERDRKNRTVQVNEVLYKEKLIAREEYIQSNEDLILAQKRLDLLIERQKQDSIYRSTQISNMQESLNSMRNSMTLIRERHNNLTVKSPIDGQIGSLDIVPGQAITNGTNIGVVNNLEDFKIESQIDEHYIDRVSPGITGEIERNGNKHNLLVSKVYPNVKEGKFQIDLIFTGEKPKKLRSGQTHYINMELGNPSQSILIPRGTFFPYTGGTWIYVLGPQQNKAFRRNIKIGRQNPDYYEVLEGLVPGEKVVISGYESFGSNEILIFNK